MSGQRLRGSSEPMTPGCLPYRFGGSHPRPPQAILLPQASMLGNVAGPITIRRPVFDNRLYAPRLEVELADVLVKDDEGLFGRI